MGTVAFAMAAAVVAGGLTAAPAHASGYGKKHPVYAVAHGVNDLDSLRRARAAGANSIEIDICANHPKATTAPWYVSHDCDGPHGNLTTAEMFAEIADPRATSKILLVWLDIKTPDKCHHRASECSTRGLADQAKTLTSAGVQVLYDLTSEHYVKNRPTFGGPGFANLAPRITAKDRNGVPMEGVGFWGGTTTAVREFKKAGVPPGQRVLEVACNEEDVRRDMETATRLRDKKHPELAAVLAWTMYSKGYEHCDEVLGKVDGMIAGNHYFGRDPNDVAALRSIYHADGNEPAKAGHRLFRR